MDDTIREFVRQRAAHHCEYCRMPQEYDILPFQIDHIISLKHRGSSEVTNLALSCYTNLVVLSPISTIASPASSKIKASEKVL